MGKVKMSELAVIDAVVVLSRAMLGGTRARLSLVNRTIEVPGVMHMPM